MSIENSDRLTAGSDLPAPAFQLWQRVQIQDEQTDDRTTGDTGIIVGLALNLPGHEPGWWYWVSWDRLTSAPWLRLPHVDEAYEQDLRPV